MPNLKVIKLLTRNFDSYSRINFHIPKFPSLQHLNLFGFPESFVKKAITDNRKISRLSLGAMRYRNYQLDSWQLENIEDLWMELPSEGFREVEKADEIFSQKRFDKFFTKFSKFQDTLTSLSLTINLPRQVNVLPDFSFMKKLRCLRISIILRRYPDIPNLVVSLKGLEELEIDLKWLGRIWDEDRNRVTPGPLFVWENFAHPENSRLWKELPNLKRVALEITSLTMSAESCLHYDGLAKRKIITREGVDSGVSYFRTDIVPISGNENKNDCGIRVQESVV